MLGGVHVARAPRGTPRMALGGARRADSVVGCVPGVASWVRHRALIKGGHGLFDVRSAAHWAEFVRSVLRSERRLALLFAAGPILQVPADLVGTPKKSAWRPTSAPETWHIVPMRALSGCLRAGFGLLKFQDDSHSWHPVETPTPRDTPNAIRRPQSLGRGVRWSSLPAASLRRLWIFISRALRRRRPWGPRATCARARASGADARAGGGCRSRRRNPPGAGGLPPAMCPGRCRSRHAAHSWLCLCGCMPRRGACSSEPPAEERLRVQPSWQRHGSPIGKPLVLGSLFSEESHISDVGPVEVDLATPLAHPNRIPPEVHLERQLPSQSPKRHPLRRMGRHT